MSTVPSSASPEQPSVDINWTFWSAQLETIDAVRSGENDLVVFRGGYGSGKTILGTRLTIETALEVPKSDNLILAPDSAKGGPTTYKVFFEQLPGEDTVPDEGGEPENSPIVDSYNRNKSRVTLFNGSVIRLGSADVWNRYAGAEFNFVYADEVAHYENTNLYDLHEMIVSRQRTEEGPNISLWTSTGNGFNQFYDITERHVGEDDEPLAWSDRMEVIVASSLQNPFLNEKDKMRSQFEGTERETQALHGGFAAATGLVYPQFSRSTHIADPGQLKIRDDWRMYGYDHGWNDPRVLLEIGKTPHDQYVIVDSFYASETKVSDAVSWLTDNGKPHGTIYCEHEPEHQEEFKEAGYSAEPAIKDLDEGIPEVRERLETDSEGRPGLLVSESCTDTIQEFLSYQEDEVGTARAEDHAMDALRYAVMGDTRVGSGDSFMVTQHY